MKRRLFKFAAICASMLAAATFVSCDKNDDENPNGNDPEVHVFCDVEYDGLFKYNLIDDIVSPLMGCEFLFACTDTTDLSTKLTDFPEKYMSCGSGVESYIYCSSENGGWSRTAVPTLSNLGAWFESGKENENDVYGYAENHFVVKRKNGVAEYYLKYTISTSATETVKEIAPDVLEKHENYMKNKWAE